MKAVLELASWMGSHTYGWLHADDGITHAVQRVLSKKEARVLNKQDTKNDAKYGFDANILGRHREGHETARFDSLSALIAELPGFIARNNLDITEVYLGSDDSIVYHR